MYPNERGCRRPRRLYSWASVMTRRVKSGLRSSSDTSIRNSEPVSMGWFRSRSISPADLVAGSDDAERPVVARLCVGSAPTAAASTSVLDDCTHQCLALVADTSLSGIRVVRELDRLVIERGKPKMVVSDNAHAEEDAGYRRRPPDLIHRYFISLKSPTARPRQCYSRSQTIQDFSPSSTRTPTEDSSTPTGRGTRFRSTSGERCATDTCSFGALAWSISGASTFRFSRPGPQASARWWAASALRGVACSLPIMKA